MKIPFSLFFSVLGVESQIFKCSMKEHPPLCFSLGSSSQFPSLLPNCIPIVFFYYYLLSSFLSLSISNICTTVTALYKSYLLSCAICTPFEYLLSYLQMPSVIQVTVRVWHFLLHSCLDSLAVLGMLL